MFKYIHRIFLFSIVTIATSMPVFSTETSTIDDNTLSSEGGRLGRAYNVAMKADDITKQNEVIDEFNSILEQLRKQHQVDIFTNAFNNINIPITNPETDAILYSRALMNAYAKNDTIAIEDASDIAETVKKLYSIERDSSYSELFAKLYKCAVSGAISGKEYSQAADSIVAKAITDKANIENKKICNGDSVAIKIFNDSFDYYSISITTAEEDAVKYSNMMKHAIASGKQANIDAVARITGYVYEHYSFDRNKEEAEQFNNRVNELIATEKK